MVTEADNLFPVTRQHNFRFQAGFYPLSQKDSGTAGINCFQFGPQHHLYLNEKSACRKEDIRKYYLSTKQANTTLETLAINSLITQLETEQPERVKYTPKGNSQLIQLNLSGNKFQLLYDGQRYLYQDNEQYINAFDAFVSHLQEDIAIVHVGPDGHDQVDILHICFPNHWSPANMLGKCFAGTHAYVPEMEHITRRSAQLYQSVFKHGALCRDTWGLATDTRLNHHPEPPPGVSVEDWTGRMFDPDKPELWLRTEHQTLLPFQDGEHIAFLIHTRHQDVETLTREQLLRLTQAIRTMPPKVRDYKGLSSRYESILSWLQQLASHTS